MHLREPTGADVSFRPDVILSLDEQVEPSLPLGSDGVQRWIWRSRFGEVLIEVVGEQPFVNGQAVAPYVASTVSRPGVGAALARGDQLWVACRWKRSLPDEPALALAENADVS